MILTAYSIYYVPKVHNSVHTPIHLFTPFTLISHSYKYITPLILLYPNARQHILYSMPHYNRPVNPGVLPISRRPRTSTQTTSTTEIDSAPVAVSNLRLQIEGVYPSRRSLSKRSLNNETQKHVLNTVIFSHFAPWKGA